MKVLVNIEIETTDYDGEKFKKEIDNLINDIDPSDDTRLLWFSMTRADNETDERDFRHKSKDYY